GALDEIAERAAQLVHRERARVEHAVGDLAERPELLALAPDAVGEDAARGSGMRPARLAEAAHELVVARLEVEHFERDAACARLTPRCALPMPPDPVGQNERFRARPPSILGARPVLGRSAPCALPMPPDPVGQNERFRARPPSAPEADVLARRAAT